MIYLLQTFEWVLDLFQDGLSIINSLCDSRGIESINNNFCLVAQMVMKVDYPGSMQWFQV